ncbi:MAG: sodium/proline symporter, partial [Caulobacterales bacterium]|uniref:sodium/proline symporter n=1 Tax=Glycocaulis sp. TaxID=1969725 RepID=UPI003FA0A924
NRTETDFLLGGRALGPWVAGLSYAASTSSAWVLLGFSGFVYAVGLSALWMVPGILGGYVVMWVWFGPRMRAESAAENQVTLGDFMAARATGTGRMAILWAAALLVLFCFIFYIAAQFGAAAIAFESQFQLGRLESVLIGAGIILLYSLLGGFWAVSVTDTLQGAIMALVAILLPVLALVAAGGPSGVWETLQASAPEGYLSFTGGREFFLFTGFAFGIAGIGLGTFGQPQLMSRLMAVKDEAARKRAFAVSMGWGVIVYAGMITLALSGRALLGAGQEGEALFYTLSGELLPPVLAGIIIAAILSAVMSTVDSLLIATSAAVSHDMGVARRFAGREVLISRIVMAALCAAAVVMALAIPATIFDRVLFSWSALGAAFGPIIVARVAKVEPSTGAILTAMALGFGVSALFFLIRGMGLEGTGGFAGLLADLAALPGSPFERVVPWFLPLLIVFVWKRRAHA